MFGMEDSMAKFTGDSQPSLPRHSCNEIYGSSSGVPLVKQSYTKEEMSQKSSCSHTPRDLGDGELSAVKQDRADKTEESPSRSLSPEFLLKATKNGVESENCEATEARKQIPGKEDNNSTNAANDVATPVTCTYCNKVFPTKSSLDAHERSLHDGKKVYDCSVCDKQFSHRSSRNIHLRVHTGQRPYECEICKKRFRVSSHLRDHVRTHTGERPFKCVLCGRGFKQSSDMKKHRKTHFKTSLPNARNKVVNLKKEEDCEPLPAISFMVVRPDDPPGMQVDYQNDAPRSPSEQPNRKVVEKIKLVKVERRTTDQNMAPPSSFNSRVKVESDNCLSPENVNRDNKYRFLEPTRRNSTATELVTTARMPATNDAFGNPHLSDGVNFLEKESATGFVQSVSTNGSNCRTGSDVDKVVENIQEKYTVVREHSNVQPPENHVHNSIFMETGNDEITKKPDVGRGTCSGDGQTAVHEDQANFSNYRQLDEINATPTSTYSLGSRSIFVVQRTDRERTDEERASPSESEIQNEMVPMDVQRTVDSDVVNVGNPLDEVVDDLAVTGEARRPESVRRAVVVKMRNDKGNATFRRNAIASTRKQARPTKRAREGSMQCASCLERFRSLEIFTAHRCGKDEKSFKCSVCGKMFARSTLLRQHMVLHQGTKRFKFKCTYCGRAFRHRSHLRDHERIHTGERPFKCSFCPKAFKQSSDLRKHENLHTGATRYCCEKCGLDFKRCDALKKHALLHAEGEVTVLKCEKCQSLFATADGHSSHVCQNKNRYRCQLCVQRFSNAASLRQHCHQEHGDQSNETCLKCEFCKLELQSLDELEVHLGTHQLLKTHKCNICDQRFSLMCQLEEHAKTHNQNLDMVDEVPVREAPDKPFRITDYTALNQLSSLYEESNTNRRKPEQNNYVKENGRVLELAATPSLHTLPSSSEPVRQTYDFIPSSYQSLIRSVPMYGYGQNEKRCPPTSIKEPGSYCTPRRVEPQVTSNQDGENMGSRRELANEPRRMSTTSDDQQVTANTDQMKDSPVHEVDNHFLKSLRHEAPKRKYTCLNCMKVFYSERILVDHVCDIQSERYFECLVCEKEFSNEEDLRDHMRNHWKQVVFLRCNLCGERLRDEELLKKHNLKHMEYNQTAQNASENPGPEYETPGTPWSRTRGEQPNGFASGVGQGNLDVVDSMNAKGILSTAITSLSTSVITSVSGNNGSLSKSADHEKTNSKTLERGFTEHHSLEIKTEMTSPLTSPHMLSETAGNRDQSLIAVTSANKESMSRSLRAPHVTYFDTRKPMTGAYLNVFGQGSAVVVPAMPALDASGHYASGNGLIYPIAMTYQRHITEYK